MERHGTAPIRRRTEAGRLGASEQGEGAERWSLSPFASSSRDLPRLEGGRREGEGEAEDRRSELEKAVRRGRVYLYLVGRRVDGSLAR